MKTVVLIKQVPDVSQMQFDPATRRLRREGVRLEVSSFDVRALLKAIELRAAAGGEVVAMTMGPPQARDALVHCLALGADRAIHLLDPAFAGADTLATARALALALRREGFDLVLCGRSSVDAETGQVGPEVAELLDVPQVTGARTLEIDPKRRRLAAERETDEGFETIECFLPTLVSAAEDLAAERFPKRAEKEAAAGKPIEVISAAELSSDLSLFGAAGSPTNVEAIQSVEQAREGKIIAGEPEAAVRELVQILAERGLLSPAADMGEAGAEAAPERRSGERGQAFWVVVECFRGEVRRVCFELLGKAVDLAAASGGEVAAVLLGHDVRRHIPELAARGAERVLVCDDPLLVDYTTDAYAAALTLALDRFAPRSLLLPSTAFGRDLAPRVAARRGLGLTGDCIDLTLDAQGRMLQWKPAFGGNIVAPIVSRTRPEMATVRPGMFAPAGRRSADAASVVVEEIRLAEPAAIRTLVADRRPAPGIERAAALDEAAVAIGVGKGIGGAEHLSELDALAAVLGGAALAATRDVTDAGWLPRQHQVGLTGRAIAPRLYFAIGVRGAFEHMVGLRRAGTIVAVNKNPKAPVFAQADLGIVAEWQVALPLLVREIATARKPR